MFKSKCPDTFSVWLNSFISLYFSVLGIYLHTILKIILGRKMPPTFNGNQTLNQRSEYQCVKCKDCFFRKDRYDQHMKEFHNGIKKVEKCRLCEIGFPDRQSFIGHIKSISHKTKLKKEWQCNFVQKCPLCAKTNLTKDKLSNHLKNAHHPTILFLHNLHQSPFSKNMKSLEENGDKLEVNESEKYDCPFCPRKYFIQDFARFYPCQ